MSLKFFNIICGNKGRDFEIGKKLILRDKIEGFDYVVMQTDLFDKRFSRDLMEALKFSLDHQDELEKYKKQYIVVTSARYIVQGFIRI